MVEKNWGKGTLASTLRCPWTTTWIVLRESGRFRPLPKRLSGSSGGVLWELNGCRSFGGSSGGGGARRQSGRERDCTPGAELPGCRRVPLRRSSSSAGPQKRTYALNWRGVGKWVVIFNCAPFLRRRGRRNWLARLVTVGGVLSEMHISLKKECTDFFQSLYVYGNTRDPKQHPKSRQKCCFNNMSRLKVSKGPCFVPLNIIQQYIHFPKTIPNHTHKVYR